MEDVKIGVFGFFGFIVLTIGLGLALRMAGIWDTRFFGRAEEDAKTQAYEGTKTYRDGVRHDLDDLCLAYTKAKTSDEKQAITSVMVHRIQSVPSELVPACAREIAGGGL